jgi:hypothetical protein
MSTLAALGHHIQPTPTDFGYNKTANISTPPITCKTVRDAKTDMPAKQTFS